MDNTAPTSQDFTDGYAQAFRDIADLLGELAGTDGPHSSFTNEGDAAVNCVSYMLRYGSFDDAALTVYSGDKAPKKSVAELIRRDLLDIKPNPYA